MEASPWKGTSARIRGRKMEASPWKGLYIRIGDRKIRPVVGMGKTGILENCDCMGFLPEVGTRQVVRAFRLSSRGLPWVVGSGYGRPRCLLWRISVTAFENYMQNSIGRGRRIRRPTTNQSMEQHRRPEAGPATQISQRERNLMGSRWLICA